MTTAEILRAAKAKIADPARWCQGTEARNEEGEEVFSKDDGACQWCALGATSPEAPGLFAMCEADDVLNRTAEQMGYPGTDELPPAAHLNDTTDHATVMALYDRAIALAEQEGADHDRP